MKSVCQRSPAPSGHEGWVRTHPLDRDADLSSFPLSDRSMKLLVSEKDRATSEAQPGAPLDDPEWAGWSTGEDGIQYGRVTPSCSHSSTSTATAMHSPGPKTSHQIQCWAGRRGGGDSLYRTPTVCHVALWTLHVS